MIMTDLACQTRSLVTTPDPRLRYQGAAVVTYDARMAAAAAAISLRAVAPA